MLYSWNSKKTKEVIHLLLQRKTYLQIGLLLSGSIMVFYGAYRGEVDLVFGKAVKLCLECVGIG